jgi:hypothetical protein
MNKTEMLQMVELLQETRDYLGVEDTPEYKAIDFMPIASDRFVHAEATLALATDIADACKEQSVETAARVVEAPAN